MTVEYSRDGDIAVVTLANPPVNSLTFETRQGIVASVVRANADPAVSAIVLTGNKRAFCGGGDLHEFNEPDATRLSHPEAVNPALENSSKPIVAAIDGMALGGGLELALACHYRIAAPGIEIGLPEVKLGLIPGGGGTQRLPRVLGVETALNMIVSGMTLKSDVLASLPGQKLFDAIATSSDRLLDEAVVFARKVAADHSRGKSLPLVRNLACEHSDGAAYFQFARNMLRGGAQHFVAPLKAVDLVETATVKQIDEGFALEMDTFIALLASPQSKALRHIFLGERAASRIADVPENTPKRDIARVAVIGAGTMGGGIAMNFLSAGFPVTLLEMKQEALDRGVATIRMNYEAQVKKGKLKRDRYEQQMALLATTLRYDDLNDADLIIEAVFEDMDVKQTVFKTLDAVAKRGAILATNTSTLDVDRIAGFVERPQDVVGLHFFSPANVMKLLEVVRGARTGKDVMATVMSMARKIRKTAVVSGVCDGFIGNRMLEQYIRQSGFLVDEGALPQQIDKAIESFGFAMGPFRMGDLAGHDIGWAIRQRRKIERPEIRYSTNGDKLVELGRLGQKTGAGWYDYKPGSRNAIPSKLVETHLEAHRKSLGITPRAITDDEIVQRLLFALINEGARILEEGIAARASDIDMVYLTGYGFPPFRGGPMLYADQVGLSNVVQAMKRFRTNPLDDAAFWEPAPLLARLAADGNTFN